MIKLNGGYVMLNLNDTNNIYAKAKATIGSGKPILVYDDPECYYADSISLNGDGDVVIIKGGKTININDANAVSSTGDTSAPTMEKIKDLNGNLRFVEGDTDNKVIEGITWKYGKWSLSGSHLMCVIAGDIANNTSLSNNQTLSEIIIPNYILDKIFTVFGTQGISINSFLFIESTVAKQDGTAILLKDTDKLIIRHYGSFTATSNKGFRIQFDLLIDAE